MDRTEGTRVAVSMIGKVVFASLQIDLRPHTLAWLREDLSHWVVSRRATRVLLDLSGLPSLDEHEYGELIATARILALLGAATVLVGMRPGMVAALASLDVDLTALPGACDVEQGLALPLRALRNA
jgi:rsbT antagonist protein RsbS